MGTGLVDISVCTVMAAWSLSDCSNAFVRTVGLICPRYDLVIKFEFDFVFPLTSRGGDYTRALIHRETKFRGFDIIFYHELLTKQGRAYKKLKKKLEYRIDCKRDKVKIN